MCGGGGESGNGKVEVMGLDLAVYKRVWLDSPDVCIGYMHFNFYRNAISMAVFNKPYNEDSVYDDDGRFAHLLFHSDCEGVLYSHECEKLVEDYAAFAVPEDWPPRIKKFHEQFVGLCKLAADNEGIIQFS